MKIVGTCTEVSKKANSFKAVIDKKNYYSKEDLNQFVGKIVEVSYHDSEPYDYNGNQITSKFIDSIVIMDKADNAQKPPLNASNASSTSNATSTPQSASKTQGNAQKQAQDVDWEAVNLRKERSMAIAYAKDLVVSGKIEMKDLYAMADALVKYISTGEQEIPF